MLLDHVFMETRPLIDAHQSGDDSADRASNRGNCGTSHFGSTRRR
jgi:hypothetical protein